MTAFLIMLSLIAASVITVKLAFYSRKVAFGERFSMAMIGSALVLNIAPILANQGMPFACPPTPFDDWGSAMLRFGIAGYFLARVSQHWRANEAAKRQARRYFEGTGL